MKYPTIALATLASFWLSVATFASPTSPSAAQEASATQAAKADQGVTPLLSNVQLIGASITAGFGNSAELKLSRNVPLAEFLRAAWADHNRGGQLEGKGDALLFQSPHDKGRGLVARARATSPSVVIAIDFLFWYGFGADRGASPRRVEGLELGLKELEAFECPLVIGTIPNVDHALRGKGPFGGPVIARYQFPTEQQRTAMNERINAWAAEREHVEVIDVDGIFRAIVKSEPVEIYSKEFKPTALGDAFQEDFLHLNLNGYVWTTLAVCEALSRMEGATDDDFVRDPEMTRERFLASIQEAQAKQAVRAAKREARKAAREARNKEHAIR